MRRALRRVPVAQPRRRVAQVKMFPAPTRGLVQNESMAAPRPGAALVLDNWFPTTTGARVRGGTRRYATLSTGGPAESLMTYHSGSTQKFFGATEDTVFDITNVTDASAVPAGAAIIGQTAGYYGAQQFGTSGGDFLVIVNGADVMWQFDGTNWYPVNANDVRTLDYDGGTGTFARGQTLTGGTSGATATIIAVNGDTVTGTLYIGPVTGGPYQDNEAITSATGVADADGADTSLSTVTITNVGTDALSHIWSFASRLFFIERETMNAWYLPVDSIGGAASAFSLAGVMQRGGTLIFGGRWSLDSGDGLDDKCVFVSSEGEIAVYEGTNPGSASEWALVGLYRIGRPMGKNATMRAGGDLLVATDQGLIPVSAAIQKDFAALESYAVSAAIRPTWQQSVRERSDLDWEVLKWPKENMLIVSQPRTTVYDDSQALVANLQTGAWCRFAGPDVRCLSLHKNHAYFGANDGRVYRFEDGGSDDGAAYTCTYVGQFDHCGAISQTKSASQARATFISADPFTPQLSASANYRVDTPAAPASADEYAKSEWDFALWDIALWDGVEEFPISTQWLSIVGSGFTLAPQVQVTFGVTPKPNVELVSFEMTYHLPLAGGVVV